MVIGEHIFIISIFVKRGGFVMSSPVELAGDKLRFGSLRGRYPVTNPRRGLWAVATARKSQVRATKLPRPTYCQSILPSTLGWDRGT